MTIRISLDFFLVITHDCTCDFLVVSSSDIMFVMTHVRWNVLFIGQHSCQLNIGYFACLPDNSSKDSDIWSKFLASRVAYKNLCVKLLVGVL